MFSFFTSSRKRRARKKNSKDAQALFFYKHLYELGFVLSGFVLLLTTLSLISHNPMDPSPLVYTGTEVVYLNWCGALGAAISGLLLFSLGVSVYLLVVVLWLAWFYRLMKVASQAHTFRFWFGVALFISSLVVLVRAAIPLGAFDNAAGWLGEWLYLFMNVAIGFAGTISLAALTLFFSISLLFEVSPVRLLRSLVALIRVGFGMLSVFVKGLFFITQATVMYAGRSVGIAAQKAVQSLPSVQKALSFERSAQPEQKGSFEEFSRVCAEPAANAEVQVTSMGSSSSKSAPVVYQNVPTHDHNEGSQEDDFQPSFFRGEPFVVTIGGKSLALLPPLFKKDIFSSTRMLEVMNQRKPFILPAIDMLLEEHSETVDRHEFEDECRERGKQLEEKLRHFGIRGSVVSIKPGPVVTLFEYQPEIDVKISSIVAREDDLAMVLRALSIRIVAPIPGTNVVGFEISNRLRDSVYMSDLLTSVAWHDSKAALPLLLGVDTTGNPVVQDLATMPHLLVAGSTGAGKSVCMHSLLLSLLSRKTPQELRIILVDPKRLEFAPYADIPHLLFPIVTDPSKAVTALKWVVREMERRYELMAQEGVRNIGEYQKVSSKRGLENLPYTMVMIDELADLMIVAGKDIELQLVRIAQMARAAGIHVVIATQRPSVDVVTGLIKANFPSRLACRVSSKIDSRTIIDASGAEKLLGKGDMLFLHGSAANAQRAHGAFVSESQVEKLTNYLRSIAVPEYIDFESAIESSDFSSSRGSQDRDELYPELLDFLDTVEDVSISMLQRRFRVGFNRAARLIEHLEEDGLLAPAQAGKPRKILKS